MKKITLLSDTHSFLDDKILKHVKTADEIWHAGDIGSVEVAEKLASIAPLQAVYGNIDGGDLRKMFSKDLFFTCEGLKVYITHIGGYPKRYDQRVRPIIERTRPDVFICGHSHICKVIRDQENKLLHINPGAAGNKGFHKIRTLINMKVSNAKITEMEVVELGSRSSLS
ncbi:MAG: metallophosphatase family protein [Bacteroidia bacterium]|nr:metallophosphatase family protein [Bacteroidia bacterium]NNC84603.1 metallophosphoesterase family protein [Bacteroidia bacterium]